MARFHDRDISSLLDAAAQWAKCCLVGDGSLLGDGQLWTAENLALLDQHFVQQLDDGSGDFFEKLAGQMASAPPAVPRLMAEVLWVLFLFPSNMGAAKKREGIGRAWFHSGTELDLSQPLLSDQVLSGVGSGGTAFNTMRWRELVYAIPLFAATKAMPESERAELVTNYERMIDWLEEVPREGERQFRHMLRFLLFPDQVERMSSNGDRRRVLAAFGIASMRETHSWTDRQFDDALLGLRRKLQNELGTDDLDFYRPGLVERWKTPKVESSPTGPGTSFAAGYTELRERFLKQMPGLRSFDSYPRYAEDERGYKDELVALYAQNVTPRIAKQDWLGAGTEAIQLLTRPLKQASNKPQNIVDWRYVDLVRKLDPAQRAALGSAIAELTDDAQPIEERVDAFVDALPSIVADQQQVPAAAQRSMAGFYLTLANPQRHLFLKTTEVQRALRILDPSFQWSSDTLRGADVLRVQWLADRVLERLQAEGWKPKDMIDVQGFLWVAVGYGGAGDEAELDPQDVDPSGVAEAQVGLTYSRKPRNLILFGPPGTGKTYELLRMLEREYTAVVDTKSAVSDIAKGRGSTSSAVRRYDFVTFHQSFSYEDFMEGLTPVVDENTRGLCYEVKKGVFLRLCERARSDPGNAYAMVIDEINRGNLSKVFGELITLIETDKRAGMPNAVTTTLPYSGRSFSVPANVDLIGTMNTADRSLAGFDIAMRRRFRFVDMPPRPEKLQGKRIDGIDLSAMLKEMNQRIAMLLDSDHQLGHAYFMNMGGEPGLAPLASVFRQQILPLLQEYFFDDWQRIAWVLNDHRKQHEFRFVVRPRFDVQALFGSEAEVPLDMKLWRINEAAFDRRESYLGIIGNGQN